MNIINFVAANPGEAVLKAVNVPGNVGEYIIGIAILGIVMLAIWGISNSRLGHLIKAGTSVLLALLVVLYFMRLMS